VRGKVFMSKTLGPCPVAAHASANAIATDAISNAVRIAVGQHSAVRTSTVMIRDGKYGMASGRGERLGFYVNGDPDFPDLNRSRVEGPLTGE
jgi:hypothetical protein